MWSYESIRTKLNSSANDWCTFQNYGICVCSFWNQTQKDFMFPLHVLWKEGIKLRPMSEENWKHRVRLNKNRPGMRKQKNSRIWMHASESAQGQRLGWSCPRMATAVVVTMWVCCLHLCLSQAYIDSRPTILPFGDHPLDFHPFQTPCSQTPSP